MFHAMSLYTRSVRSYRQAATIRAVLTPAQPCTNRASRGQAMSAPHPVSAATCPKALATRSTCAGTITMPLPNARSGPETATNDVSRLAIRPHPTPDAEPGTPLMISHAQVMPIRMSASGTRVGTLRHRPSVSVATVHAIAKTSKKTNAIMTRSACTIIRRTKPQRLLPELRQDDVAAISRT